MTARVSHSLRLVAVLSLAAAAVAGCSSDESVGEGVDLNVSDQARELRLGETTTTLPPTTVEGEGGKAALGATTTTAAPTTTTAPPRQVALVIAINSDETGSTQFDPSAGRVFQGSLVEWVNRDTVPRSVVADNGAFDSGMIPPGGSWVYDATTAGAFNYHDGTRPYAVGTLEVVPR